MTTLSATPVRFNRTHVSLHSVDSTHEWLDRDAARQVYTDLDANAKLRRESRRVTKTVVIYTWTNRKPDTSNPKGVGSTFQLVIPREWSLEVPASVDGEV